MAFFLTPRFVPAYTAPQCNPWGCSPRPTHSIRRVSRPAFPSFVPFLSQVDELLTELDREARREAHRQRQLRKRIARAHFNAHETKDGYQVDGEIVGFEQEHIDIEVTDDNTLRVTGDTNRKVEQPQAAAATAAEPEATQAPAQEEAMDGVTLNEPEAQPERPASPTHSDSGSHKSYQATVEDDFEDVGAEFSSTVSVASDAPAEPQSKGKERAVEEPTEAAVQQQLQSEASAPKEQQPEEQRFQGSFERTFRFPERIDASNVKASLQNGLLSITVPKAKAPEVKRIMIQ